MKLVFINAIIFTFALCFWLTYSYIYPRKKIPIYFILIACSLFPIVSIWRKGVFESGDFSLHAQLAMLFYESLKEGVLVPKWATDFCGLYGYPHFFYFYKLPYYITSLFHEVGLSYIASMKLLFSSAYVISGLSMYIFLRNHFSKTASFLGAILYLFTPYQLTGLHFRHDLGELFGYILIPILFLATDKLLKYSKLQYWLFVLITYSSLIFSHHIAPVLITLPLIIYASISLHFNPGNKKKRLFLFLSALLLSILLTAFHWAPMVFESHLVYQHRMVDIEFVPTWWYLYSPWRYGLLFQGNKGQLGTLIGYSHLVIVLLSFRLLYVVGVAKKNRYFLKFFLTLTVLAFLLMQPFSEKLWHIIPLFDNFQFASRLLAVTTFTIPFLSALVVTYHPRISRHINKRIIYTFALMSVVYTILNWGNRGMIPEATDASLRGQIRSLCGQLLMPAHNDIGSFLTKISNRAGEVEVIRGDIEIKNIQRSSHSLLLEVLALERGVIQINTTYFLGWNAIDNGKSIKNFHEINKNNNFIRLNISEGHHRINIQYTGTVISRLATGVSILSIFPVGILALYLIHSRKRIKSSV